MTDEVDTRRGDSPDRRRVGHYDRPVGDRPSRPRRRRLSREESRKALLDEGLRMVDEHPVGPGPDHVEVAGVVQGQVGLELVGGARR